MQSSAALAGLKLLADTNAVIALEPASAQEGSRALRPDNGRV